MLKIAHGGWLPLVIGWLLFTLMTTWKTGRQIVAARLTARAVPLEDFLRDGGESTAGARAGHGRVHDGAAARHARRRWRTTFATTRSCTSTSSP